MGEEFWLVCVLLALGGLLLIIAIGCIVFFHRPKKEELFAKKAAVIKCRPATVVDKSETIEQEGSFHQPTHRIGCEIKFRYYDGEEEWLGVPPECYELFTLGMEGDLLTQNGELIDFADLFSLKEEAPGEREPESKDDAHDFPQEKKK